MSYNLTEASDEKRSIAEVGFINKGMAELIAIPVERSNFFKNLGQNITPPDRQGSYQAIHTLPFGTSQTGS